MSDVRAEQEEAILTVGDRTARLPILRATDGTSSIDVSTLTRQTGYTALDYGFVNTARRRSPHHLHRRRPGNPRYRGYPIAQLAKNSTYLEVAWLLIYGELPRPRSSKTSTTASAATRSCTKTSSASSRLCRTRPTPCRCSLRAVSALSTYYENETDPTTPSTSSSTRSGCSQAPVIAAYAHKKSVGQAFLYPDNSLSFVDNFLKLNFGVLSEIYEVNPVMSRALERLLILHEDHEQNASTSTVRLVGSTGANMFPRSPRASTLSTGPLHGGANEAVLAMLARIRDSGESVQRFVERVKEQGGRGSSSWASATASTRTTTRVRSS